MIIYTVTFEELLQGSYTSLDSAIKGIRQQVIDSGHAPLTDDEPVIQLECGWPPKKIDEWEFWSYLVRKSELF